MPKRSKYPEITKIPVRRYGYVLKSRKGSHVRMTYSKGRRTTILASNEKVKLHNYKSILKQTGLSEEDIEKYL
jgi:predicted RNA binding protein YcfA (HicA-like mRNA interferase family)